MPNTAKCFTVGYEATMEGAKRDCANYSNAKLSQPDSIQQLFWIADAFKYMMATGVWLGYSSVAGMASISSHSLYMHDRHSG